MQDPFSFLAVLLLAPLVYANDGTTTFDTILLAHAEPSICPSIDAGVNFKADSDYIVCCYNGLPSATRTTAKGSGGKTVYACCEVDYTCTGAAPVMSDWSVDSNGAAQLSAIATPPIPAQGPTATAGPQATTSANPPTITTLNLDTVSSPGATPYSTQPNGVVIYNNINNGDGSGNSNSNVSVNKNSGSLTGGAIAGITVACTVIGTVLAAMSVWYARRQTRNRKMRVEIENAQNPPATVRKYYPSSAEPVSPPQGGWSYGAPYSEPDRQELDSQAQGRHY